MRGNSLRFFKPPVFIKTFLVFCAIFAAQLFSSCKQLASFDPGVDGARVAVNKTFAAPTGVTATQGRKRIISLEWTPVSGARYYDIYCAKSATAEFAKVGETNKNSFDDKVGAGSTMYYKVCAVKSNGTQSAFSTIVKGTSLAQPVISGIVDDKDDFSVTISWFMENACGVDGRSNYEDELKFEVFCEPKNGGSENNSQSKVVEAKKKPSSYECAFENLASSTEYQFYVVAYLDKDQQNTESSPKVDKTTLTSYEPFAPVVSASEGTSEKGVWLSFALPEMVKVNTVTKESQDEKVDELYPLYFKVSRVIEDSENYEDVCDLYYNGTELTETPVEYEKGGKPYEVGAQVKWFDDGEKLVGGVKYKYRIRSFVDTNYSKLVCPEGKEYTTKVGTKSEKATPAIGWKCALPSFKVKSPEKKYKEENGNNVEVLSYEFGFSAEWNDLGKAGDYKFAIKQNRRSLGAEDSAGEDTWCKKDDGSEFFGTLEEINSYKVKFGSNRGLDESEKGLYSYTLYIVSKSETEVDESNVLVKEAALDTIQVTEDVNLPEALLDVEGGYKNKVVLKISNFDDDVKYKITRTMLEGSSQEESKEKEFYLDDFHKCSDGTYEDNGVQDNCRYSYILTATNPSGAWAKSQSKEAETLGTPDVSFEKDKLSYDSVTISFYGVLAAEKYLVKLGEGDGFGGGEAFEITKGDEEWNSETVSISPSTAKVVFAANKFTVTINKPYGYNDATKAGDTAALTVTAKSDKYPAQEEDASAQSKSVPVKVLGPALLDAKVNAVATTDESISLTWSKVEGAKGYLIRRVMYSDAGMTKPADGSGVTYYCDASDKNVTVDGEKVGGRCTVTGDAAFTLTDTYMEKSGDNVDLEVYHEAQAKIAWGLPFRYVVLPVFDKKDFDFESNSLALKSRSKVMYNDLTPTAAAATFGYGLNLVAEKATSGTHQKIVWNVPNKLNETQTAIYRRMYTTDGKRDNEFVRITNFSSNDTGNGATILVENDNLCNAFEYVVKYYEKGVVPSPDIRLPDSLFNEMAKQTEEPRATSKGVKIEQKNKGYLLAVDLKTIPHPNPDSQQKYIYADQISWTPWDYDIRAVGPETMELTIRNYNIDAENHGVFLITADKTTGKISVDLKKIDGDTDVEEAVFASAYNVMSKDLVAGKGTASGMLKVLRDLPHYMLTLKNGEETVSYEKNAHRHITSEELVRAATLAIAYGIQKTGPDWTTTLTERTTPYNESYPGSGSAIVKSVGGTTIFVKLTHDFTFTNFTPAMPTRAGEKAVFLTVNGAMRGTTDGGGSTGQSYAPKTYTNGSFTVRAAEDGCELYNATITISSLTVNGTSGLKINYSVGGEKEFGNITPFTFGNGNNKYSANPLAEGKAEWQ